MGVGPVGVAVGGLLATFLGELRRCHSTPVTARPTYAQGGLAPASVCLFGLDSPSKPPESERIRDLGKQGVLQQVAQMSLWAATAHSSSRGPPRHGGS